MEKNELRNACSFFQLFEKEVLESNNHNFVFISDIIRRVMPDNINLLVKDLKENDKER